MSTKSDRARLSHIIRQIVADHGHEGEGAKQITRKVVNLIAPLATSTHKVNAWVRFVQAAEADIFSQHLSDVADGSHRRRLLYRIAAPVYQEFKNRRGGAPTYDTEIATYIKSNAQ